MGIDNQNGNIVEILIFSSSTLFIYISQEKNTVDIAYAIHWSDYIALAFIICDTTILRRKGNQNKPQIKTVRDFDIFFKESEH